MKKKEVSLFKLFALRLSIMLLILAISRWLLYVFNSQNFNNLSFIELLRLFFIGLRFDISTLVIFNIPIIIFYGLPLKLKYNKVYKKVVDIIYIIGNSIAVGLNLIDVIYFRYIDKRMTSELFSFITDNGENQGSLVIQFAIDFWYMLLIFIIFTLSIILLTRKTQLKKPYLINNITWYISNSISFLILVFCSVIGIRGGFQLKPINILAAARHTSIENVPLVINTPFSIIKGNSGNILKKITFFSDEEIESMYTPKHENPKRNRFVKDFETRPNFVIIILESFGQEVIGFYNKEMDNNLTPFLDSILSNSLVFDGMANGRKSIEALPSIFCGIPSLIGIDYPSSRYSANHVEGIGFLLKRQGYTTAFFHGGNNGTMSFDATAAAAGFDYYYGRTEYNNDNDFDGRWGIFDMPFLQYTVKQLDTLSKPFISAIFTLSSHHPFKLPKNYDITDKSIETDFEKTVRYTDDALRAFFETAKQKEWFDSTVFIITADHVNPEHLYENYINPRCTYRIPLAFYSPCLIEPFASNEIMQQADINISIAGLLNLNDSIFSFGRNVFDTIEKPSFISYLNNIYQYSDGQYLMQTDGDNIKAIYNIIEDPLLENNIYDDTDSIKWQQLDKCFKLHLQQYNNRMINNKLYIKR